MPAFPAKARLLNEEQLQQFILRELGAPQLQVALVQEDLDQAIDQAKRWFAAKKGFKKTTLMQVFANVTEYELPSDVDTVIDLSLPSRPTDFSRVIDPLGLLDASIPYNLFPAPAAGGLFSTYAQALMYIKASKRITGGEEEWYQQDRTLFVFPIPKTSGNMMVLYKSNQFTLDQLSERDHDLVKRYALAWCKRKLGHIHSRYSQFPGAQGSIVLDGQLLLAESREDFDTLDQEIGQSGFPMGFLVG